MRDRPIALYALPETAEYVLIVIGGLAGIAISVTLQSPGEKYFEPFGVASSLGRCELCGASS